MRALAFALIFAAGACSAVDDFSRFHFSGDGAAGGGGQDLAVGDLSGGHVDAGPILGSDMTTLPGFGESCTSDCSGGLTCYPLPNGGNGKTTTNVCSKMCMVAAVGSCPAGATCITVENTTLCMPNCDLTKACRSDLTCCANMKTSPVGVCAPPMTDFCGKG